MKNISIRNARIEDKEKVLKLLDEFREDCILQITGKNRESNTAQAGGSKKYEKFISRDDYVVFILENNASEIVGIITGYLCPILRSGSFRAEVEEFFVKKEYRGNDYAKLLMDKFIEWAKLNNAEKINLESDNELERAHSFYKKYGFKSRAKRFVIKF